jgi:hypothetical protein
MLRSISFALVLVLVVACASTKADEGRDAALSVKGAQFYRADMPAGGPGPKIVSVTAATAARAGSVDEAVTGELGPTANAVAIGLAGDVGYWIVPAKVPSSTTPGAPTFDAELALALSAPVGPQQLVFRAVDAAGTFGPALGRTLAVEGRLTPTGRFVVSLTWSNQADLDLHVVLPSGLEIFKRNRTEYQRSFATGAAAAGPIDGGVLDRDSNANCAFDGVQAEDVVWAEAPPKGHYVVRVDTSSLCGEASAAWRLEALLDGSLVGAAQGLATDADLRFPHDRGGGVLALEVDVP